MPASAVRADPPRSAAEVRQHGKHASMVVRRRQELQLGEDVRDVGLDGLRREEQPVADRLVRPALRHQRQDLALPIGQVVERHSRASTSDELRDDLGIDDRAALRDAPDGVREVVEVVDPVLEEIADTADGFEVVGEAPDGTSGLAAARSLRPDLVLLDIGLPDVEGFEIARELAVTGPPPLVVLTSSREASEYGPRLTSSRVLGFIPKDELSGEAIRALAGLA